MIRLIALDIDGTLLDSAGLLPPANVDAIARAVDAGIEVVLATGRRFEFARAVFERLPGPLTLITSNGAVVKASTGETLLRHLLPRLLAGEVLAAAPEHRDRAALLFDREREGQIVYERVDWDHPQHGRFFRANRAFISEIAPLEAALTEDPLQVMFTGSCRDMRALFERFHGAPVEPATACGAVETLDEGTAAGVPAPPYAVALTEYTPRDFSLVDIIRAGCSKGAALRDWASRRGIARGEVMAMGDNLNDLQMLAFAGHPVVMGNAVPELKGRGWTVTATNDAAGVARAIDAILPPARRVLRTGSTR